MADADEAPVKLNRLRKKKIESDSEDFEDDATFSEFSEPESSASEEEESPSEESSNDMSDDSDYSDRPRRRSRGSRAPPRPAATTARRRTSRQVTKVNYKESDLSDADSESPVSDENGMMPRRRSTRARKPPTRLLEEESEEEVIEVVAPVQRRASSLTPVNPKAPKGRPVGKVRLGDVGLCGTSKFSGSDNIGAVLGRRVHVIVTPSSDPALGHLEQAEPNTEEWLLQITGESPLHAVWVPTSQITGQHSKSRLKSVVSYLPIRPVCCARVSH